MLRLGIILALVILAGYGLLKALPLLSGPSIALSSPEDGESFPDGTVKVAGTAEHTQKLMLDGAPLLIDQDGHFSTTLVLPHGGAILTLTATDRFGTSASLRRAIFVP